MARDDGDQTRKTLEGNFEIDEVKICSSKNSDKSHDVHRPMIKAAIYSKPFKKVNTSMSPDL